MNVSHLLIVINLLYLQKPTLFIAVLDVNIIIIIQRLICKKKRFKYLATLAVP